MPVSDHNPTEKHWIRVILSLPAIGFLLALNIFSARASGHPTFESDILPLLQARCLQCHGESPRQAEPDLRTLEAIRNGGQSGPAVDPGKADRSLLIEKIVSGTMPPGEEPLSSEEIGLLRRWIDQGARPDAYERMVERLLAFPHYGERWAQHWLDLAGYADSEGIKNADRLRPHAWRYRDYVIRALNQDKPCDRFLTEQLAGDELVDYKAEIRFDGIELLAATGFLRMASDPTDSPSNDSLVERMDVVHDEIQVLGSSVMGMTIGCARCHDHKYDPISQKDYYRFSAILQTAYDPYDWIVASKRLLEVDIPGEQKEAERFNQPIQATAVCEDGRELRTHENRIPE